MVQGVNKVPVPAVLVRIDDKAIRTAFYVRSLTRIVGERLDVHISTLCILSRLLDFDRHKLNNCDAQTPGTCTTAQEPNNRTVIRHPCLVVERQKLQFTQIAIHTHAADRAVVQQDHRLIGLQAANSGGTNTTRFLHFTGYGRTETNTRLWRTWDVFSACRHNRIASLTEALQGCRGGASIEPLHESPTSAPGIHEPNNWNCLLGLPCIVVRLETRKSVGRYWSINLSSPPTHNLILLVCPCSASRSVSCAFIRFQHVTL
jgi:hypothetical protein